jgi:hypothetical protein
MKKLAVFLCVALAAVVSGQQTKSLVLRGRVVDSNAHPIPGAEVAAYKKQWICYNGPYYAELLGPTVKTNGEGRFMMKVQAGPEWNYQYNIFIVARKAGLAYAWDGLNYSTNERAEGDFNLILEKPGVLSGRLLETDSSPVAGAKIRAVPKNYYLHRLKQRPILGPEKWFTTETDAQGKFSFGYLPPDAAADFMAEAPGRPLVHQFTTNYLNSCGYEVGKPEVKLVLPPKTTIQGRVVDAQNGTGVPGVPLMLQIYNLQENEHLYYHYRFESGEDGSFSIEAVPPGRHVLRVVTSKSETGDCIGKNTLINIEPDEALKTVAIKIEKSGLIRVQVFDEKSRQPLPGVHLSFENAQFTGFVNDQGFLRSGRSGSDGIAIIRCPVGRCDVGAYRKDYEIGSIIPIMVREGQTSTKDIYLERKSSVTGTVTDESGRPVEGAFVTVHPFGDETFTDSRGGFAVNPDRDHKPKWLFARHIDRNFAAAAPIRDPAKPLHVILKPAVSIVGQITDTNGRGIPAARVTLNTNMTFITSDFTEVITNQKGSYEIKALAPQQSGFKYLISIAASGYGTKRFQHISVENISSGSVTIPTIALLPADASISGRVVYSDGSPAPRVPIFLSYQKDAPQPIRNTATDENGMFVINRVCKGPLAIQANFRSSPGGSSNIKTEGGDRDIKIVLGQAPGQTQHVSLVGKPLPGLTEFDLRPSSVLAGGKRILVCFWDLNQRPSRNCVQQLTRRAKLLAGKDIYVILAQTPAVPDQIMIDWLRQNRVIFPVGRVKTGPEALSKTWGVQSLPWLILTNTEHIVTDEGFSVSEIGDKIK